MPRSLQLEHASDTAVSAAAASTMSMIVTTSPWKRSGRTGRPTAASFSAGDSRSQHQTMLAFEQQLDALVGDAETAVTASQQHFQDFVTSKEMEQVIRGSLERSVSTSSSIGFAAGSQSGASETKSSLRLSAGNKITGRRHRTPRRFEVTDIPDFDEFNHTKNGLANDEARRTLAASQPRQGKTEVKGRFTIIDLSPASPSGSPRAQRSPSPLDAGSKRPSASPRRRMPRKPSHQNNRSEYPTTPSSGSHQQVKYIDPVDSAVKARRVDLNVFDRHLDHLQKESAGMRSLLEGMVSTNARWIEALGQAGVTFQNDHIDSGPQYSDEMVADVGVPAEPDPPPSTESSIDAKYAAMELAYIELQKKHELLLATNKQLEEQKVGLESRLQQQTQASEDLRAELQHYSQYADNVVSDSDPSNEYASDGMSMFEDQSYADVEDQSPSGAEFGADYDSQYEATKNPLYRRRRRRYSEEECMSDTSSEGSMSKYRSRVFGDEDNNYHFSDSMAQSDDDDDDDVITDPRAYEPATALDAMIREQAFQLRQSLHEGLSAKSIVESRAIDSSNPAAPFLNDLRGIRPSSNQLAHGAQTPGSMFAVLKRNDSLTSLFMNNYSTVSSNSSIASMGIQVAALTKSASGTFMTASGTRFRPHGSPMNQSRASKEEYISLSGENLFFHNSRAFGKGPSSFGFDPREDPSFGGNMIDEDEGQISAHADQQFSQH